MGSDELMGTAKRCETPGRGAGASTAARGAAQAPDHGIPADADPGISQRREPDGGWGTAMDEEVRYEIGYRRPLWVEEPARRRRLPDPVRTSAVRAMLIISVTLIEAVIAFLCTMAGSWLAFPMVLSSVAGTVVATWGVLDVWITRQVWNQRHGVVSAPSSTARAVRRERRAARRQARTAEQRQERIRRQGGTGRQLSHP